MTTKWLPSARLIANVVGLLIIVALVAPFVFYTVPQLIGATESYVVQSGSMEPAIETGSVLFVYETDPATIEEGDIVTYDLSDPERQVTTHRVVGVVREDGRYFRTKGDANEEADQYLVPAESVVGTVPTVDVGVGEYPAQIPYLGRVLVFMNTRLGIIAFVFVPAGLLVLSEVYSLIKAYRESKRETATESGGRG